MDWTVALNSEINTVVDNGTVAESDVIHVKPGQVAMVSLYNLVSEYKIQTDDEGKKFLVNNDCIEIHKVSFGEVNEEANKIVCDCKKPANLQARLRSLLNSRDVFKSPMFSGCKPWKIDPCNNTAVIAVPGSYVLRLLNVEQLEDIRVEYTLLDSADVGALPNSFIFGA